MVKFKLFPRGNVTLLCVFGIAFVFCGEHDECSFSVSLFFYKSNLLFAVRGYVEGKRCFFSVFSCTVRKLDFTFKQSGTEALLLHMIRDNMSDLPTAEAFWRLGMVNSAKRYMTDIQQSILNARKSGRCTKRIAECHIVNGDYKAAEKRLNILKNTIFYRAWAEDAETYLYNDAKVNSHETWGKLRRYRYKDSFLYSYPEKHKMLGLLFQQNTDNRLALSYFMGQLLLDGEFNSFMG